MSSIHCWAAAFAFGALSACGASAAGCHVDSDCAAGPCVGGVCRPPVASGTASATSGGGTTTGATAGTSTGTGSSTSSGTSSSTGTSTSTGTSSSSGSSTGTGGSTSGTSGSSTGAGTTTGTGTTGTGGGIGPNGGSVPRLIFGVVGDTRPAVPDDTANYPTAIITQIFQDLASASPQPQFVLAGGDYMNATSGNGQAAPQLDLFLQAAKGFPGQLFPAMGNHECAGKSSTNCGPGNTDGTTENYTAFLQTMLGGVGLSQTEPYYSVNLGSSDPTNPWTAKIVVIAANAWDQAQQSWLTNVMQQATTYTFVVRHEPTTNDATAPGGPASDAILQSSNYTLLFTSHTHTYQLNAPNEIVVGVGGAPLSSSAGGLQYGYVLCSQRADGAIVCSEFDYNSQLSSYANPTVIVTPAGVATQ